MISTPVPFFEEIASTLHLLPPEDHQETFNLKKLAKLVESERFQVLEAEKFMMSPVGFPAELTIEKVMKLPRKVILCELCVSACPERSRRVLPRPND